MQTEARQDISFTDMRALQEKVESTLLSKPYVAHVGSLVGGSFGSSTANQGHLFVELKSKRPPLETILSDLRRSLGQIPGISSFVVPVQDLRLGGRSSASQYQFVVQGIDRAELLTWADKIESAMTRDGHFVDVTSDVQDNAPQAHLIVDADKARLLGITSDDLRNYLYDGFGTNQASTIFKTGDSYEVIVEFDPTIPWTADSLNALHIRSSSGKMIPVSAFAKVQRVAGLLSVNQQGQLPAVTISFNLPAGVSLGQATDQIDQIKAQIDLPSRYQHELRRDGAGVPGRRRQSGAAAPRRGGHHLRRARHPLRELHPSAHHPDRPAGGRGGRAAHAAHLRLRRERDRASSAS